MSITLKQAQDSRVTPTDDARLYNYLKGGNIAGIVSGCELTGISATTVSVGDGWGLIYGREFVVSSGATVDIVNEIGQFYICVSVNLSNTDPVSVTYKAFGETLNMEDLNDGGDEYDLVIGSVSVTGTSTITVNSSPAPVYATTRDTWNFLGTATGTAAVSIADVVGTAEEFKAIAVYNTIAIEVSIPAYMVENVASISSGSYLAFISGAYRTTNNYQQAQFTVSASSIALAAMYNSSASAVTSSTNTYVFYR